MNTLTREQAEALGERIVPIVAYFLRLGERMEKVGFLPTDRLYQIVFKAQDAHYELRIALHYQSCKGGVARPPDPLS